MLSPQQTQCQASALLQVWFEASAHTSRLHFHAAQDGSAPLGLSLPMGTLQGLGMSASLQDLLQALDTRQVLAFCVCPWHLERQHTRPASGLSN